MNIFPPHQIDFYKSGHIYQYPNGTELVFSNFTPRASRMEGVDRVVFFGLQYFIKEYLIGQWNRNFFGEDINVIIDKYRNRMDNALGEGSVSVSHLIKLHDLGYLPIEIKAVPEGSLVDLRVPMFVIYNTLPEFFWLTNYLETVMSSVVWGGCTSATVAVEYKRILDKFADATSSIPQFTAFQGHDFSCRGMMGFEAACISGAAHLTVFNGTDTVGAIDFLDAYYGQSNMVEPVGFSVPATEHSVMSLGGDDGELETIRKLITETYPTGTVSIVCDTWDFWKVLTDYLPKLKEEIMSRDGKVVIRPDSGDPVKIICGDREIKGWNNVHIYRGAVQCLWEVFGGTNNEKGFKELDSHIGLIYGDSITLERCHQICAGLHLTGFASTNVVFGIGSYTYQHTTRDVFGFALKATYAEVNGKGKNIFKKPKTDDGTKNSAKGLTAVYQRGDGSFYMRDQVTWDHINNCALQTVYKDGALYNEQSIYQIREEIKRGM